MDKYKLTKEDAESVIERLRQIANPSSAVQNFINAYETNENVTLVMSKIEEKPGE